MEKTKTQLFKKHWLQVSVGAIIGFASAYFGIHIIESVLNPQDFKLSIELILAGGVAMLCALMGTIMIIGLALPKKHGVKFLNFEDTDELAEQEKILWGSSFVMLAIGIALFLLILSGPDGYFHPATGFSAMSIAFIFSVITSVREWPHYDEMMRKLTIDSTYLTASILFTIIWFWCSAAWIGWVAMPTPIILLALFIGIYLISTFIIAGKMGLTKTR